MTTDEIPQYNFFDSTKVPQRERGKIGKNFYPWLDCPVGKSFGIPFSDVGNDKMLRAYAYAFGKSNGRKFRVTKHDDYGYEIARIE